MGLTLDDLLVDTMVNRAPSMPPYGTRPATLADLVEVVKNQGGEVVETELLSVEGSPMRVLPVGGPSGSYLILGPLDEEK